MKSRSEVQKQELVNTANLFCGFSFKKAEITDEVANKILEYIKIGAMVVIHD